MPWAKKLPDDMKVKQYPEIPDEAYHFEKSTDYEVLPEELGDEEIVKRLGAVREKQWHRMKKSLRSRQHAFTRFITNYFYLQTKT